MTQGQHARAYVSVFVSIAFAAIVSVASGDEEFGLIRKSEKASPGFTLISPVASTDSALIDMDGKLVHRWPGVSRPGLAAYLLDDGSLLRCAKVPPRQEIPYGGGTGGRIQRIAWNGEVVWDFTFASPDGVQHHDIEPLPNGNVLLIAWETISKADAVIAGRAEDSVGVDSRRGGTVEMVWSEKIVEIQPEGKRGGKVVWEWRVWDHLVQDHDETKPNYGSPVAHPELIDINHIRTTNPDWIHMNSIDYHESLDQILVSARWFHEVWVIDHGTTTQQAASHTGGRRQKGGDLLYRWGNPFAFFGGLPSDRMLFAQHDASWIPAGAPGAGNVLVFSNGDRTADREFSSVHEFKLPIESTGEYPSMTDEDGNGPNSFVWSFRGDMYSPRLSGAQRLPNGNTLICVGEQGHLLEVAKDGEIVWEYRLHPIRGNRATAKTDVRPRAAGRRPRGRQDAGSTSLFRATRYSADHPAFQGKQLTALADQSFGY